jgi:hypothetical protein
MTTTAWIHAEDLRFPDRCAACDGPATVVHELSATRSYDFLVVAAWEFLDLPVPLCATCARRRRLAAIAYWMALPAFILVGAFVAFALQMDGSPVSAAILGALVVAVALLARFRGDDLLEWHSIGVRATLLRGKGSRLRLHFRRAEYAATWRLANPHARDSRSALDEPQLPAAMPADSTPPFGFTRTVPALTLAAMLTFLSLHDWNASANRESYPGVVLFLCLTSGLALAGTIHPPLFYAVGKYGTHLPVWKKAVAVLFTAAGFAIGMWLLFVRY